MIKPTSIIKAEFKHTSWAFLFIATTILLLQANHPTWNAHLYTDLAIHYNQVNRYQEAGSWSDIPVKEYQPGALWFFLLPSLLSGSNESFNTYQSATFAINILLIAAHFSLYKRYGPPHAPAIFILLLLATGPILLFRFDLLVTLLTLVSWIALTRTRSALSGLLLGISTATKLYPVILIPIMTAAFIQKRQFKKAFLFLPFIALGIALVTMPFLLFSGTTQDVQDSINQQNIKPVGIESLWSTGLTIVWQIKNNTRPAIDGWHGIKGIATPDVFLPPYFYNYFWLLPVGLVTLLILWKFRRRGYTSPLIPLIILTAFILSCKVLNPQYVWWPLAFLPLTELPSNKRLQPIILITISVAILILTQLVYPIYYSQLLEWFQGNNSNPVFFLLSLERNALLIIFFTLLLFQLWSASKPSPITQHRANPQHLKAE